MAETVLIHGYATGIEVKRIYKAAKHRNYEFRAFTDSLGTGAATIFSWDTPIQLSILQALNPTPYLKHYQLEKRNAESIEVLGSLDSYLLTHNPQNVVAHSMGGYLLLNYLKQHDLPESVQRLTFLQADVPSRISVSNTDLARRIEENRLIWTNYYCPWDVTLLLSAAINRYLPGGIIGVKNKLVDNKHFPLNPFVRLNLHLSSMSDPKLLVKLKDKTVT